MNVRLVIAFSQSYFLCSRNDYTQTNTSPRRTELKLLENFATALASSQQKSVSPLDMLRRLDQISGWVTGLIPIDGWEGNMALKISIYALALFVCAPLTHAIAAPTCTPTGFLRDNINLTAARINPATLSGDLDATGCNIGVYYSANANGHIENANIHGSNYFGIVNNGAHVDVRNSTISDIGEKPFNGTQHGVAIYWAFSSAATGDIQSNYIWNYQKGGIVVNGPNASSHVQQNVVVGLGPVNFIAQNGIQAGYGANAQIEQNVVSGNSYTGANFASSGGILVVGGDCYGGRPTINTRVQNNTGLGNDVGVWFSNLDGSCNPLSTVTGDTAQNNYLVNNAINNTT